MIIYIGLCTKEKFFPENADDMRVIKQNNRTRMSDGDILLMKSKLHPDLEKH